MDSSGGLSTLESELHIVLVTRFAAGSALVLSLWDVLIKMDREVRYIWPLKFGPMKALYLFVRYGNVASLLYANHIYSGINSPNTDLMQGIPSYIRQPPGDIFVFIQRLATFRGIYLPSLRLYAIWDKRTSVKKILIVALAIVHIPVFVLGGISVLGFTPKIENTVFVPVLNTCVTVQEVPVFKFAFGCVLVYDVLVVFLAACNALDRPRGPQDPLVANLMLFAMRAANFLFFLFLPVTKVFCVIFLTWAIISLTLARMLVRIEATKDPLVTRHVTSRRVWSKIWIPTQNTFDSEQANWADNTKATDSYGYV
ncbi:hypothetical protein BC629DRAFT_1611301 [Irpex lacteus]|nr:hypothetical protein BC629DRAFT_1611301 [Irpex lacteus]